MDGGCISILRAGELNHSEWRQLDRYREVARLVLPCFSIRVKKPEFNDLFEKEQLIAFFGYLPKTELTICGFADAIFAGAEDMIRMFGGYLYLGLDRKTARKYRDHTTPIIQNLYEEPHEDTDYSEIYVKHLSDAELVAGYFNSGGESLCKRIGFKRRF